MDYAAFFQQNIFYVVALGVLAVLIVKNEMTIRQSKGLLMSVLDTLHASNEGEVALVDVRAKKEFDAGHLPQAEHVEMKDLESRFQSLGSYKNKKIVFYCDGGNLSTQACIRLKKLHKELDNPPFYSLVGGIHAWREQKLPTTKK